MQIPIIGRVGPEPYLCNFMPLTTAAQLRLRLVLFFLLRSSVASNFLVSSLHSPQPSSACIFPSLASNKYFLGVRPSYEFPSPSPSLLITGLEKAFTFSMTLPGVQTIANPTNLLLLWQSCFQALICLILSVLCRPPSTRSSDIRPSHSDRQTSHMLLL